MTNNKKISLIEGKCGSGKSHAIYKYILTHHKQQRFIVGVPTLAMQNECVRRLGSLGVGGVVSPSSADSKRVGNELAHHLDGKAEARVIVATHKALDGVGRNSLLDPALQHKLQDFAVFMDEVPNPMVRSRVLIEAQQHHLHWLGELQSDHHNGAEWLSATPDAYGRLQSAYNEFHASSPEVKSLLWILQAGYPVQKKRRQGKGYEVFGYAHAPILELMKHCRAFHIAAANVARSPIVTVAKAWCGIDAEMAPQTLQPDPERNHHRGRQVHCHALIKGRASLYGLSRGDLYQSACKHALQLVGDEFIYATNSNKFGEIKCAFTGIADAMFAGAGIRTPFVSHGINLYGGVDAHGMSEAELGCTYGEQDASMLYTGVRKAVWMGIARLSNEEVTNIKALSARLGRKGDEIINAIDDFNSFEVAYQMTLRTSLRMPNAAGPFEFVFVDDASMQYFIDNYVPDAVIKTRGFLGKVSKGEATVAAIKGCVDAGMRSIAKIAAVVGRGERTVRDALRSLNADFSQFAA